MPYRYRIRDIPCAERPNLADSVPIRLPGDVASANKRASLRPMPMRATTVRFGEDLWAMLEQEAAHSGLSAAQFVREATILRLAMLAGMRGDDGAQATLGSIAQQADAKAGRANGHDPVANAVADAGRLASLHK